MRQPIVYDEAQLDRSLRIAFEDPEVFRVPKGIMRFDYESTHAWRVNIARDKAKFVEYFYDGQSGSVENGLRRAILLRHEILSSFPVTIEVPFGRALAQEPEKRIRRITEPGKVNPYICWMATWHDRDYSRKTKSFSVTKFGEEVARKLALEAATKNHNGIGVPESTSHRRLRRYCYSLVSPRADFITAACHIGLSHVQVPDLLPQRGNGRAR
jgi:hypothetical protein